MGFHDCLDKASLKESNVIIWREAKLIASDYDSSSAYKGYLMATNDELIFVKDKGLITGIKVLYRVPLNKIKSVKKVLGLVLVNANVAKKKAHFLKKLFSYKNAQFKIKDSKSFIKKIEGLIASSKDGGESEESEDELTKLKKEYASGKITKKEFQKKKKALNGDESSEADDNLSILKKRYAKGEITKKEYEEIKKELEE